MATTNQKMSLEVSYKSIIQEFCHKNKEHISLPKYKVRKMGPEHTPSLHAQLVKIENSVYDVGSPKSSKRKAEQRAADRLMGSSDDDDDVEQEIGRLESLNQDYKVENEALVEQLKEMEEEIRIVGEQTKKILLKNLVLMRMLSGYEKILNDLNSSEC